PTKPTGPRRPDFSSGGRTAAVAGTAGPKAGARPGPSNCLGRAGKCFERRHAGASTWRAVRGRAHVQAPPPTPGEGALPAADRPAPGPAPPPRTHYSGRRACPRTGNASALGSIDSPAIAFSLVSVAYACSLVPSARKRLCPENSTTFARAARSW